MRGSPVCRFFIKKTEVILWALNSLTAFALSR
nr:MAG TPA: hypothetical protein [Caudoviricetes sp.]